LNTPKGEPEQLQMKPTLIGAPVAWADDGLADEALPAAEVGEVEVDDEDLLLDEHAAIATASATTPPSVDQRLRLGLITLDLLHPTRSTTRSRRVRGPTDSIFGSIRL
jgi:hypothetical protein